ncbi:MAG TPA: hypothetical protein VNG29_02085 [Candidatus Paceibacterota bacterium]|nr:hypothetical protein [Candidatus Paceibacterota bacterium]
MQDLATRVDELSVLHKIIADRESLLEELNGEIIELKKKIPDERAIQGAVGQK